MPKNYESEYIKLDIEFGFTKSKQALKDLLSCGAPSIFEGGPLISQCVGTKRLWGAALGNAFAFDVNSINQQAVYEQIAFYSRAYLVIQDYIMDEEISKKKYDMSKKYLETLSNTVAELIESIGGDSKEFHSQAQAGWNAFHLRQNAEAGFDVLQNAKDKTKVFFNPYGLTSIPLDKQIRKNRMHFLNNFFDVCQILDDYQDMEEDVNKHINHNLFLFSKSKIQQEHISQNKKRFAAHVIKNCAKIIKSISSTTGNNPIFCYYHRHAQDWLAIMKNDLRKIGLVESQEIIWSDDPPYARQVNGVCKRDTENTNINEILKKIRPEFLQTGLAGVEYISDL